MAKILDLELSERDGKHVLCSPEVGWFTRALPKGALVSAGENAGTILALGRSFDLRVPEGVVAVVASDPPPAIRHAVGFGDVLYELAPVEGTTRAAGATKSDAPRTSSASADSALRSPQSGRFYHRPAPGEPAFVTAGAVVQDGTPIGLIEVMKTFSHVTYRATGALPQTARVLRFVVADGADVRAGDVLLEVEREEG